MIIYGLLKLVLWILDFLSSFLGDFIPSFPESISTVLTNISTILHGGIEFGTYFFHINVLVALITLVISYHGFRIVKDAVMKVIGHFLGN